MNSAVAQDTWQGKVVNGRFRLLEWLGSSESSSVFRTELAGGNAAIKLIPAANFAFPDAQIAAWKRAFTLSHPNLLRVLDAGACELQGTRFLYVVMELADEDLSQVIPVRPLTPKEAREMLSPLISALSYLHSQNLLHGALKPSNILAVQNQLKISSDRVREQSAVRKPSGNREPFDAPELARGEQSPASDVWSLGATLIAALGQRPQASDFNGGDPEIQRYISEPFRQIARECLRQNPSERCTLQQVRTRLDRPSVPAPVVTPVVPRRRFSRSGLSRAMLAAIACTVILIAGVFVMRGTHNGEVDRKQPAVIQIPATPQPEPTASVSHGASRSALPASGPEVREGQIPVIVERNIPSVPASARNTVHGKVRVIVRVAVNDSGEVSGATLVSPGPSRYFARLALESAQLWKFQAARGASSAPSAWTLKYLFGRSGTEVFPVPATQ
jgi:TonB family protein